MNELNLVLNGPELTSTEREFTRSQEWLVTNGLGGYASGTVLGMLTRRYHALLVAALPSPLGRTVMLNHVAEQIVFPDGSSIPLMREDPFAHSPEEKGYVVEFRLEQGLPVWKYKVHEIELEKRIVLPHHQNTAFISYRCLSGSCSFDLQLRPAVHFRPHEASVNIPLNADYAVKIIRDRYELSEEGFQPVLRLYLYGDDGSFIVEGKRIEQMLYRMEEHRGYESTGGLWSPGYFQISLAAGKRATLGASTESWEVMFTMMPDEALIAETERRRLLVESAIPKARTGPPAELVLAADQFIISPAGRVKDEARARAAGFEMKTIIAGYHWFTDWGRDTMISLEGLTLVTGRASDASSILRAFLYYLRDGLIPNMFPEGHNEGLYHTADATLWFFHALDRYLAWTGDRGTLKLFLPKMKSIIEHHLRGTRFNIRVDSNDGLISQGEHGYQLTWMDAKVGDWVVTPRRGKTSEINALWYNALRLIHSWITNEEGEARAAYLDEWIEKAHTSFNKRFWYEQGGYLYDVIDGEKGDDPACRPNQLLAISLHHPVLRTDRWKSVVDVTSDRLLTPVGLRSLAPGHPEYKPRYYGDVRSRDAAYHQGTVWAWLIGPFIDAWIKVYPGRRKEARLFLEGFLPHLKEKCVGTIGEVFDGDAPFHPHGCVAQAWSVAEVLRAWIKTEDPHTST
ncbi:MAG: amylo-alpha-1,6-glucosidase [Syntrophorhabdaceae bacterium]